MSYPKNLAQLKKYLQVGVKLLHIESPRFGKQPLIREVTQAGASVLFFKGEQIPEGEKWRFEYPKASEISFTDNGFKIVKEAIPSQRPEQVLEYQFL